MTDERNTKVNRIKRTSRTVDGTEVLKVGIMVAAGSGMREFIGRVYEDKVILESDPDDLNLHPDDLKDLMYGAAHEWRESFEDWGATIVGREEPVGYEG